MEAPLDPTTVFIVFGAAVRPDGTASGTLRRRTLGALALSRGITPRQFLLTGGQGRYGPAEAQVMRDLLLAEGVPAEEIAIEPVSLDTLESALRCARLVHARPLPPRHVVAVSSRYHTGRCRLLLRMLGVPAHAGSVPADRSVLGLRTWLHSWMREFIATPWDAFLLLVVHRLDRAGRPMPDHANRHE